MNIQLYISRLVHAFYFHTLRCGERIFGPGILFWMIVPEIMLTLLKRLEDFPQFRKLRASLPAPFWKGSTALDHFARMLSVWISSLTVTLFYDRLNSPAWQTRITIRGTPPGQLPDWGQRPVVIAFLHTGGFPILRYWLRAQLIPAASYLGGLPRSFRYGRKFRDAADRRYKLDDVPHVFLGSKSLREALRFLQPGRSLLVALEELDFRKSPESYSLNGHSILLNQIPFRIAVLADALLMPAIVQPKGLFRFEIAFGQVVPAEMVREGALAACNLHLLRELWQGVEEDPSVLTWTSLEALAPHLIASRRAWP